MTRTEFADVVRNTRLFDAADLDAYLAGLGGEVASAQHVADRMLADGRLTPFQVGQLLKGKHRGFVLGKYRLLDRIGMGGMGQVFLAEHAAMGRRVAIKVLPPDRAKNEFAKQRFLREARATGQLDHPNIVKAFDVDADGDVHFLVLEYVDGCSFQEMVARAGSVAPGRAAHYLAQALAGLQYLHDRGFIHRDIKPANLIVDRTGVVKLLDLGLVRSEMEGDDLTRKEDVKFLGTADYLAPEQAVDCKTVDGRADVYSLGATGYYLLTGAAPFAGESVAAKLVAHQTAEVRPAHEVKPAVPAALSAVIQKMMAKRPEDRFATPAAAIPAFATWAHGPPPPPTDAELAAGKAEVSGSTRAARPGLSPAPPPRPAPARAGSPPLKTGSGPRSPVERRGATAKPAAIPGPPVPVKVHTPPASDPLTNSPNIFTPKPVFRPHPVALKASGNNLRQKPDGAKPKPSAARRELPPTLPVTGKASSVALSEAAAPFAPPRRYSLRRRVAIAVGLLVAVAVTTWSAVRVMASGHREAPAAHSTDPGGR
jgi:serine/threonine protein kinase